jgi:hypothetical protein
MFIYQAALDWMHRIWAAIEALKEKGVAAGGGDGQREMAEAAAEAVERAEREKIENIELIDRANTAVLAQINQQGEQALLLASLRPAAPRLPILGFLIECAAAAVRAIPFPAPRTAAASAESEREASLPSFCSGGGPKRHGRQATSSFDLMLLDANLQRANSGRYPQVMTLH